MRQIAHLAECFHAVQPRLTKNHKGESGYCPQNHHAKLHALAQPLLDLD